MRNRKIIAASLLPAIMIVLVGYLFFCLHEAMNISGTGFLLFLCKIA